ncbi:MAG: hypothetical protein R3B48_21585 [Kofleriaceae bacterium]
MFLLASLPLIASCGFGDDGGKGRPDAAVDGQPDTPVVYTDHLLISEISPTGAEFVEIWNPTNRTIDLTHYFLSDMGNYWKVPSTVPPIPDSTDFYAEFPSGATIASDAVITIAFDTGSFTTKYPSVTPTYTLGDAAAGTPKMGRVVLRSANMADLPKVSDSGEHIILFYWDGASDLVKDVDIVLAGTGTTGGNVLQAKEPVDGPDSDTNASSYKTDAGTLGGGMSDAFSGDQSYKRRTLETGAESQNGTGNGITGDDETTEALKSTWDGDLAAPLSAPNPGVAPVI